MFTACPTGRSPMRRSREDPKEALRGRSWKCQCYAVCCLRAQNRSLRDRRRKSVFLNQQKRSTASSYFLCAHSYHILILRCWPSHTVCTSPGCIRLLQSYRNCEYSRQLHSVTQLPWPTGNATLCGGEVNTSYTVPQLRPTPCLGRNRRL